MKEKAIKETGLSLDWIKSLQKKIVKVEELTIDTNKNIEEAMDIQEKLIKYILGYNKNIEGTEKGKEIKIMEKIIIKKLKDIKDLNLEQKQYIASSKLEIAKSISLLKSFYEKSTKDKLTGLWNEEFINSILDLLWEENQKFYLIYFDLNGLKQTNDNYGHKIWDNLILDFARILRLIFWESAQNYISRIHWDEFNIISLDDKTILTKKLEKLEKWLENSSIKVNKNNKVEKIYISTAYWLSSSDEVDSISGLIHLADKRMYKKKINQKCIR